MKSFVAFLALAVVLVAATQVEDYAEQKYDTTEVEYGHHYQPQQQQHHHVQEAAEEHHYHQQASSGHHQEKQQYKHIPILKSESYQDKDGSYKFGFEAANGIQQQEHGYVKNAGQKDHEIQVQEGFYSYTDEHGHQIGVHYIADENGFRATGDHLPTPPPLPEALREAYAKIAANPEYHDEEEVEEHPQQSYEHVDYHQAASAQHQHRHTAPVASPVAHREYQESYKN